MTRPTKILLYAVNGLGMGHVTRQVAIAKFLRRYLWILGKHPEVFFLTTSEVDSLPFHYDFPVVKIPSKSIIFQGGLDTHRYQKMAKMMIWNCISAFDPDIMVVDTFPGGAFEELYDVMNFGFRKAFIYRPRKDKSRLWRNPILKAYDRILHIDEAHDGAMQEDEIDEGFSEKTAHFGAVLRHDPNELLGPAAARKAMGLSADKQTLCLMAGGGGDKSNQDFFARMLPILSSFEDLQVVVAAGPLYKGPEIPFPNGRWFYRNDLALHLNAFDAVVSAGGFNSVNELLHAKVPALFFAQSRLYDDQDARVRKLEEQQLCRTFSLEQSDLEIKVAVAGVLSNESQKKLRDALAEHDLQNDAEAAAAFILELALNDAELVRASELLDMQMIQHFVRKGLTERIICKTIHAVASFEESKGKDFDESEALSVAADYLKLALEQKLPHHLILPTVFEAIKFEELKTLSDLKAYLISSLAKPYYEI